MCSPRRRGSRRRCRRARTTRSTPSSRASTRWSPARRARGWGGGFAQTLLAVARDAPSLAKAARARLRRLAAENPREGAIAEALRAAKKGER
ncbi:MAG: hypothetical protein R3A48_17030 [Polyangiales bacterium]